MLLLSLLTASLLTADFPKACDGSTLVAFDPKEGDDAAAVLSEAYVKYEYRIPMRDGVKLYTVAYVPRDRTHAWPIMLQRTPYSVSYGVDNWPKLDSLRKLGRFAPAASFVRDGFIFVHQDVRGRMMSEGTFVDVRPHATDAKGVDESTDAYDTVDFLVKNVPANNGKVGVWGISYPGFYAAQAAVNAHPAVKAVSPQAPVTDWFLGDDFHHNGALFYEDAFAFMQGFGKERPQPTRTWEWDFDYDAADEYEFYLGLTPISNANAKHLKGKIAFWNDLLAHGTYDAFWRARDPLPFYRNVKPAVLTVGGLFDAQDLWGALATYRAFNQQSPGADVRLVLGPWRHGGWTRNTGDSLGDISFGSKTSAQYHDRIELPFFKRYLKGCTEAETSGTPAEAWVFETGTNLFQKFDAWPPPATSTRVFFTGRGTLGTTAPDAGFDEWVSDVSKPVPYRAKNGLTNDDLYLVEDQRFAARRPDVVVHQTAPLRQDVTVAGPVDVSLEVSTTGTDADFVVKLIDVSGFDREDPSPNPTGVHWAGFQFMVRGEVFRGRFRKSFEKPEPFVPNQPTTVHFTLPDVNHTFRVGHRLMVQVQSSWFPLVDLNPQTFVDLATAKPEDFHNATHRLFWSRSSVTLPVIRGRFEPESH